MVDTSLNAVSKIIKWGWVCGVDIQSMLPQFFILPQVPVTDTQQSTLEHSYGHSLFQAKKYI